jgi:hypothetical protein
MRCNFYAIRTNLIYDAVFDGYSFQIRRREVAAGSQCVIMRIFNFVGRLFGA